VPQAHISHCGFSRNISQISEADLFH